ncbi:hypothetical protein HPB50_014981 [Hyalomma asiaticum]|uniref:Uncharacterized protein n=1 Tax=Hyalomma asiaticum TaxID=266040 RepID=A0ACB7T0K4_HYAAI|nr:hypothetical protein HPB50_014981 [Hyalomma asiaticum]
MKPGSPVPNYLKVAGHRITCYYKGAASTATRVRVVPSLVAVATRTRRWHARCDVLIPKLPRNSVLIPKLPNQSVPFWHVRRFAASGLSGYLKGSCPRREAKSRAYNVTQERSPTSRPLVIPTEPQAETPAQHEASRVSISIPSTTSSSSAPVIDETPSPEDAASINEDSTSTYSRTQNKCEDDNSDPNQVQLRKDTFQVSSSDSEPPDRDRSPLRTSARTRKPRASAVYISDHRPVEITLVLPAETPAAAPRPWRLDYRILQDFQSREGLSRALRASLIAADVEDWDHLKEQWRHHCSASGRALRSRISKETSTLVQEMRIAQCGARFIGRHECMANRTCRTLPVHGARFLAFSSHLAL